MKRAIRSVVLAALVALVAAPMAAADARMYVGFHDDPSFRWRDDRAAMLDRAKEANATIVRAVVVWRDVAPTRPRNAANPFDSAYRFDDLDELVRGAQARDMEVLLSIWGTPKWANGGKTPNYLPRRMTDMTAFARALASRYSGRFPGYPFVKHFSVWNESNLQLFLAPQFDRKGRIIGPRNYARLYAAAYKGIKAGSPRALVAIGETSAHGRDKRVKGQSDTVRPGTFARLVAATNRRLKFDAWAHHPYPTPQNMPPTQKVLWPNVTLSSMARFEKSLDSWFKRRNIPIWITEYGHETKPEERKGVTRAQQAKYAAKAIAMARKDKRVGMFIWFVLRDDTTSLWQSGLYARSGAAKPALGRFSAVAALLDARNPIVRVRGGKAVPTLAVPLRKYAAVIPTGGKVNVVYRVLYRGSVVYSEAPPATLDIDAAVRVRPNFTPVKGRTYTVEVEANAVGVDPTKRTITLLAS